MLLSKKVFPLVLTSSLALCTILVSCKQKEQNTTAKQATTNANNTANTKENPYAGRIAFVDMDTLSEKFIYFKEKREAFEKKTGAMEAEIERMASNLQKEYASFQKKAQEGTMTNSEAEAAQKRLGQLQQSIESKRQAHSSTLMKEQDDFNKEVQNRIDAFLVKYNQDKGYDYILSYAKGGSILLVNRAMDITEDVIKALNAEANNSASSSILPINK
jgi:outer membrane protein